MQDDKTIPEQAAEFIRAQDKKMLAYNIATELTAQGYKITPAQVHKFREDNGLHSDAQVPRFCECCGKEFFSRWKAQRYCSTKCSAKMQRAKVDARNHKIRESNMPSDGIKRICPVCKREFVITDPRKKCQIYCSKECAKYANNEQNKKKQHERYMMAAAERKARKGESANKPKRPRNFAKLSPLVQTTIIAREHGMTYGKYQAQKYAAEHVKVRRAPAGYRKAGERE